MGGPLTPAAIAAASTIAERIAGGYQPADGEGAGARLERWRSLVARGDPELFRKRLERLGTTLGSVAAMLGTVQLDRDATPPRWANRLTRRLQRAAALRPAADHPALRPASPLPFEMLLLPLVAAATEAVRRRRPTAATLFTADAWDDLQRWLLETLVRAAGPTLGLEFEIFARSGEEPLEGLIRRAQGQNGAAQHDAFIAEQQRRGLGELLCDYPVLARLIADLVEMWESYAIELTDRLAADAPALSAAYNGGRPLGRVTHVAAGMSDRHAGGRTVALLHFDSGLSLVYKPKDIRTEVAWNDLLDWCNRRDSPIRHRVVRPLPRDGYGWEPQVAAADCDDVGGIARFYRRAGGLLCLVYLLNGTDCHHENVIAAGEHPVLVDTETLLHPGYAPPPDAVDATAQAYRELRESVMATGMLPRWVLTAEGSGFDPAALASAGSAGSAIVHQVWADVASDAMRVHRHLHEAAVQPNTPTLSGRRVPADDHVADIIAGFRECYRFIGENREAFLSGPLTGFAGLPVRTLFRPTAAYRHVIERACSPGWMRNGADFGIAIDAISAGPLVEHVGDDHWRVVASESESLHRMDVPKFAVRADSTAIAFPPGMGGRWPGFVEAGMTAVRRRIKAMSDAAMKRQIGYIRAAFHARIASREAVVRRRSEPPRRDASMDDGTFVTEAEAIGAEIGQQAFRAGDGSATWIVPEVMPHGVRYGLQPMGPALYAGTAGVSLFFAALGARTGDQRHADLAASALRSTRKSLASGIGPLGGVTGIGSIIYVLAEVGRLLGDTDLVDEAVAAARLVSEDSLNADPHLDLAGGTAGALLALVGLAHATGEDSVMAAAHRCGRHLLDRRSGDPAAWPAAVGVRLAGMAHGAAGIAHALLALHDLSGDPAYLQAALDGLRFERELFDRRHGNWRDVRPAVPRDGRPPMTAWCNGAPGIALSRLRWRDLDAAIADDLETAIAATRRYPLDGLDHLCCGNLGRIDVLLTAGLELARADLVAEARTRAARVLNGAMSARGRYSLLRDERTEVNDPSFFRGLAGIGYQLLRLTDPTALPSVLALAHGTRSRDPLGGQRTTRDATAGE